MHASGSRVSRYELRLMGNPLYKWKMKFTMWSVRLQMWCKHILSVVPIYQATVFMQRSIKPKRVIPWTVHTTPRSQPHFDIF